jgi:predicted AAA+ superfamily ATPase
MPELIERPACLEWLRRWRDKDLIKVVTGVRRCGKSTALMSFAAELVASGVPADHVISLNMEDPACRDLLGDPYALYDSVVARLAPGGTNYVFIDEIQQVKDFPRAADGLFIRPDVDLYLTGSNAQFRSSDLATLLAGRYVEYELLPLSFAEFVSAQPLADPGGAPRTMEAVYADYLRWGGFPYATLLPRDDAVVGQYLDGVVSTVLFKDVIQNRQVRQPAVLQAVVAYIADNVGNLTSPTAIAQALTTSGRKTNAPTIEGYLDALASAFLVYAAPRYDIRGKRILERIEKYYLVDPGLRTSLLGGVTRDTGRLLENIVYLELVRRGLTVRVGVVAGQEVDFVASGRGTTTYVQVAQTVRDERTLARELAPFDAIPDHHPRLLITADPEQANHNGVPQVNILDWLLGNAA